MSRNPLFFSRLSEDAWKEIYFKYYLKTYIYVQWLIQDPHRAEIIALQTLLLVCRKGNLDNEDAIIASIQRIATDKYLDLFKKEPWLKKCYEEYLANNGSSAELFDAAFNYALLMERRLVKWKQLSPSEQKAMISACTTLYMPLNSFDMNYKWSDLLNKYLEGNISETERNELFRQAELSKVKKEQLDNFSNEPGIMRQLIDLDKIDTAQGWESFKKQLDMTRRPMVNPVRTMAAAALITILSTVVFYMFNLREFAITSRILPFSKQNLATGKEPELILQNGSIIKLDSVPDGALVAPGVPFMKTDSKLVYVQMASNGQVQDQGINILSIPPRRQYQVMLADSSVINLNASSQLHFPVNFSTNERRVAMKGGAYFDVNANPARPFIVNLKDQVIVKVTGTSFNIQAYHDNDSIKTTLVKGSLTITDYISKKSQLLRAGQQASFKNGRFIVDSSLNVDLVTALKVGKFHFDNTSIYEVMQEIEHWYNVKTKYIGIMPTETISAIISRSRPLKEVIRILSESHPIQIDQINDTLLIVSPKQ